MAFSESLPSSPLKEGKTKTGGRILVIDDTAENRDVLSRRLSREGHYPHTAEGGEEALHLLGKESFDLILCDLIMPGMDGLQLLKSLKKNPEYRDIPVIMMSVLDDIEAIANAIEAGAEDYLPKPFNSTLLRARIGACLEKKAFRDREQKYLDLLHQELTAAARLQKSILPQPLERHAQITVEPLLKPASEVGGDFYDYFWLDSERLAFVIADVAGKGLTGALFMAISRTLINVSASFSPSPAECLKAVNKVLCQNNETMMFVTAIYGIFSLKTSQVVYANAGHCSPMVLGPEGAYNLPSLPLSNPPLGVVEDPQFVSQEFTLSPGHQLLLYTDGILEAADLEGNLFGSTRLLQVAQRNLGRKPREIMEEIQKEIASFIGEAPQSDDITALILESHTQEYAKKRTFVLSNSLSQIPPIQTQIGEFCRHFNVSEKKIYHILLSVDELLSNVILHGYKDSNLHSLQVRICYKNQTIIISIVDDGIPFNPLSFSPPSLSNSLENREVGGLGIHFVKTFTRTMRYRRNKGLNYIWLLVGKES
jgi:sigma-B regulation protein RsbU (phosphoserine phosphatase)